MRKRPEDIYKKDLLPRFSRRRRSMRGSDAPAPRLPPLEPRLPGSGSLDGEADAPMGVGAPPPPNYGGRPERRKRRSHSGSTQRVRFNVLAVAGLVGLLVLYLGLAAFFKFRRKPDLKPAPNPALATPAPVVPAPANDASPASERTAAFIKEVKESLALIDKLDAHPLNRNPPEENLRICEERLRVTPGLQELILELAKRYQAADQPSKAAEMYRKALEGNPGNREARVAMAHAHLKAREYDAAAAVATWVLEAESFSIDAHHVLASVYLARSQPRNAVPHLRAIVEGDSINVVARNNLAVAYTQIGEYDKAIKMFRGVISQDENNPVSYHNLAICLARKNDLVETSAVLRQAASRFGNAFVAAWLKGRDFDEVRQTPSIRNLLGQLDPGAQADEPPPSGGLLMESSAPPARTSKKVAQTVNQE